MPVTHGKTFTSHRPWGVVEMRYRTDASEHRTLLRPGDIFHAFAGMAHVAHPLGEARILVVEEAGSE